MAIGAWKALFDQVDDRQPGTRLLRRASSTVDDAYSSAVVAIDAQTGAVRWKFQTVHHDLWVRCRTTADACRPTGKRSSAPRSDSGYQARRDFRAGSAHRRSASACSRASCAAGGHRAGRTASADPALFRCHALVPTARPHRGGHVGTDPAGSVPVCIYTEPHGFTSRRWLPTSQQRRANSPRNNGVIDLEPAPLQTFHQTLWGRKFQQCSALRVLLQQSDRHALPTLSFTPLRLASQRPLILDPINVNDTCKSVGLKHIAA